jgi:hypothetical protein
MDTKVRETAMLELVQDSGAIRDSITVVREKRQSDEAVVALTFRNSSGRLMRGMTGLHRFDEWGWRAAGGGWSSGPRDVPTDAIWSSSGGWGSSTPPRRVIGGWVNEGPPLATIPSEAEEGAVTLPDLLSVAEPG